MRKCYFCKIGDVKPGFVTVPETTASLTIVLKEVPAKSAIIAVNTTSTLRLSRDWKR